MSDGKKDEYFREVYDDLRRMAAARMRYLPPGQTLQPTALVHEAYLRLLQRGRLMAGNRREFFFLAARAMRDILVEDARRKKTQRHKRPVEQVSDTDEIGDSDSVDVDALLAMNEAIELLQATHPRAAEVAMLRYFAGFTVAEIARTYDVSERTIERHWHFARVWLYNELGTEPVTPFLSREDVKGQ